MDPVVSLVARAAAIIPRWLQHRLEPWSWSCRCVRIFARERKVKKRQTFSKSSCLVLNPSRLHASGGNVGEDRIRSMFNYYTPAATFSMILAWFAMESQGLFYFTPRPRGATGQGLIVRKQSCGTENGCSEEENGRRFCLGSHWVAHVGAYASGLNWLLTHTHALALPVLISWSPESCHQSNSSSFFSEVCQSWGDEGYPAAHTARGASQRPGR